jgi:hypothetical protein
MGKNQDPGSGINIPDPQHWKLVTKKQRGGSVMFIPDPGSDFFPSRIRTVAIPDPGSRILKEFKYFNPKKSKKMVSEL